MANNDVGTILEILSHGHFLKLILSAFCVIALQIAQDLGHSGRNWTQNPAEELTRILDLLTVYQCRVNFSASVEKSDMTRRVDDGILFF